MTFLLVLKIPCGFWLRRSTPLHALPCVVILFSADLAQHMSMNFPCLAMLYCATHPPELNFNVIMLLIVFFSKCIPLSISCLLWNAHIFMFSMQILWNVSVVSLGYFLDASTWRQNGGRLGADVTCTNPMRVATSSLENVLLLPLLLFAAPAAVAPVVVRVRVCTAAKMLRLMIAPMSSAVGCCTCARGYAGSGSSPAIATLVEDGPMVVSRRCTI
jgi:hypothetical protein